MKRFIEGADREQSTLLPESLDDWIDDSNPVRAVDVFVDGLNLIKLGFRGVVPEATGRPSYHPSALLKLYIYGYLNRVQSSRRLEREAGRNLEVIWLLRRLTPDDKTIADFRKDNGPAIKKVCAQFVMLCRKMGLLNAASVAIDGSKFKAVNTRDKNFTRGKVERRRAQLEDSVARYLAQLDTADRQEPSEALVAKTAHRKEKLAKLGEEMAKLAAYEKQMLATPDQQVSLTDPDSRSMATSGRGSGVVGNQDPIRSCCRLDTICNFCAPADAGVAQLSASRGARPCPTPSPERHRRRESVQRSQSRLKALTADLVGLDDDLHSLGGRERTGCLQRVVAGRFEFEIVRLAADQHLRLGAAAADIDRLLVGIRDIERELVALGNQLPMLRAAAGVDNVTALGAFGPLAVGMRESGGGHGQAQDQCDYTQHMFLLGCGWRLASVGLAQFELGLNGS